MRQIFKFFGIAIVIVSTTMISCEKDDNIVSNPAEDIDWLKEAINDVKQDEYSYYVMANYKGETVFYYGNCNPLINYVSIVQNLRGDNLGYTFDLYDELTEVTILWKHEDSKCNF